MQFSAVNAFLDQYEVILDWLDKISKNDIDAITRNKAASHLSLKKNFDVYFSLRVLQSF